MCAGGPRPVLAAAGQVAGGWVTVRVRDPVRRRAGPRPVGGGRAVAEPAAPAAPRARGPDAGERDRLAAQRPGTHRFSGHGAGLRGPGPVDHRRRLRRWPDGGRLVDAFRSGYGECRAWPEVSPALFESLIIARGLHQMNLTLNGRLPPARAVGSADAWLAHWALRGHANRGKLKRWSTGGSVTCTRPGMIACRQRPLRACRKGLRR